LAADLHDLIIQRVFALGLSLSSLASQNRELAPQLEQLIDDSDRIIRELRGVIFSLNRDDLPDDARSRVTDLVHEASGVLHFTPHLEFSGPLDRAAPERIDEMLAVVREALNNVARHARASSASVVVTATPTTLRLTVTDDGIGTSDPDHRGNGGRDFHDSAHRWGGQATVTPAENAGTTLEWAIPID
jgi:signal transduction histidine kinase